MISIEFANGDIISGKMQGVGKGSGIYQITDIEAFFLNMDKISYIRQSPESSSYDNKKETWWYDMTKIVRIIDSETEHRNIKVDIINEG